MNNDITITIRANPEQFAAAMAAAVKATKNMSTSAKSNFKTFASDASSAFGGVADSIKGVLKVGATLLASGSFGLGAAAKAAWGQVDAVQQAESVLKRYYGTGKQTNAVLNELVSYAQSDMGVLFNRKDLFAAASNLAMYKSSAADVSDQVKILSRGMASNVLTWDEMNAVVGRVLSSGRLTTPEFEMLAKAGYNLDNNLRNTSISAGDFFKALDSSIPKDVSQEMDNITPIGIRLQSALRSVGNAFLGVNATGNKFVNGGVGAGVITLLQELTEFLKTPEMKNGVARLGGQFAGFMKDATPVIKSVLGWLVNNGDTVVAVVKGLAAAFVVAKLAAIGFGIAAKATPLGVIAAAVTVLVGILVTLQSRFDFIGKTIGAVSTAFKWLKDVFMQVKDSIKSFSYSALEKFGDVVKTVSDALNVAREAVVKFVKDGINIAVTSYEAARIAVENFVNGALSWFSDRVQDVTEWVEEHQVALRNWSIVIGTLLLPMMMKLAVQAAVSAGKVIASWAVAAANTAVSFAKMAADAAVGGAKATASWVASSAGAVKSFAITSYQATVHAAVSSAAWVKNAVISSYAWVTKELPKIIAGAAKTAAAATVSAVKIGASFVKQAALASAGWAKNFAVFAAGMVKMVAQFLVQAARMAAGWLLAMGPLGLIVAIVAGVVALIIANWETVSTWFQGLWQGIKDGMAAVGSFLSDAWQGVQGAVGAVIDWVKSNWPLLLAIITGPIGIAVLMIVKNWDTIKAAFAAAWEFIKQVWGNVIGWFGGVWNGIVNVFKNVGNWFGDVFRGAWNGIKSIFSGVGGFFRGVWDTIVSIFGKVGSSIGNAIGGAVKGVVNSILGFAENTINGFIKAINIAIGAINKVPGVNIGKLGLLNIPRLATGGIVAATPGGQNVTVAEGGQDEWVVPERKMASLVTQVMRRFVPSSQNSGGQSGGGNSIILQSGAALIKFVVEAGNGEFTENDAIRIAKMIARQLRAQGLDIKDMGALR